MEQTRERQAIIIGRLGDLGLGNPDGIPSSLAEVSAEELQKIADHDNEKLVEPNDVSCTACIDGRFCKHNADGSAPKIRLRRVGGSASNIGAAFNADASMTKTFTLDEPLSEIITAVDDQVGYRSAHLGGCGGANGEIADHTAISEKPAVINATRALLSIPVVREYMHLDTVSETELEITLERVRTNAAKTAIFLSEKGWDGQAYVNGVRAEYPENVEDLEVDSDDKKFHGHKEPKLTIIVGDLTMPVDDDGFTWNLKATKQFAESMSGQRGGEGYL